MTRQQTSQVAYTELFELLDINWNQILDVNGNVLFVIWPAQPFNPQRN